MPTGISKGQQERKKELKIAPCSLAKMRMLLEGVAAP